LWYFNYMNEVLIQREKMRGTNIFFSDHVDVAYGSPTQRRSIATYGLGGCSGLIVAFESPRAVVLGHFQPWKMKQIGDHREPLTRLLSDVSRRAKVIGGLLLHPGDADDSAITGYKEWASASNNERIADLTDLIREGVNQDTPVISAGYLEIGRGGLSNIEQGSVIIDLPNDSDKPHTRVGGVEIGLDQVLRQS
jgi:hypothetical protein